MLLGEQNRHLIVGGFGFIGVHLARFLLKRGEHVILFGRRPKNGMDVHKLKREYGDRLELVYGEVIPQLHESFVHEDRGVSRVYHLAHRKVHSASDQEHAGQILMYNYDMDVEVMDVCAAIAEKRPVHLTYVSSGEVYGHAFKAGTMAVTERDFAFIDPTNPKHSYPASKLAGEMMLMHGGWGFRWSVARLQNPYGPGMGTQMLITKVMSAAFDKMPVFLAEADDSRPYVYVGDAVEALFLMGDSPAGWSNYFNVCSSTVYHNSEVVSFIGTVAGSPMQLEARSADATHRTMSIEKIKSVIGWRQRMPLMDGLKLTWEYYLPTFAADRAINGYGTVKV